MAFFTSTRGLKWHYQMIGSGEPIVFIHGFGGSLTWWRHQAEFLADDFQVILVDLPGHGQSDWMTITLNDLAHDIRQLVHAQGLHRVSVVACSFGGLIAMELYRQAPQMITRISFVGSIPKFARSDNYPAGLDIGKIRQLSNQFGGDLRFILEMFLRSLFTMRERQGEKYKLLRKLYDDQPLPKREALLAYLEILETTDLRDRVSSMICPLQYITGREDYICPPAVMEWLAEHTYNARFDVIEGCGHLPFLTETSEYNRLLEDFLIN